MMNLAKNNKQKSIGIGKEIGSNETDNKGV